MHGKGLLTRSHILDKTWEQKHSLKHPEEELCETLNMIEKHPKCQVCIDMCTMLQMYGISTYITGLNLWQLNRKIFHTH